MASPPKVEQSVGPPADSEVLLAGWTCVARAPVVTRRYWTASVQSLLEATVEHPELPAPVLALDLLPLLRGERHLGAGSTSSHPRSLHAALRAYEDHVLWPLVGDRRWGPLGDALGCLSQERWPAAVGLTAARVLGRLGRGAVGAASAAAVRRLATRGPEELLAQGRAALLTAPVAGAIAAELLRLAAAARGRPGLLVDADVALVEHLAELRGLGARVALAQLADLADRVDGRLPRRLPSAPRPVGLEAVAPSDDSLFPVGGYSSLILSGAPERMVATELAAMDVAPDTRPDLFDLRLVQGELLAYARDDGFALRRRRSLALVFDPSLAQARTLDAGATAQRLQWLCAAVVVALRRFLADAGESASDAELVFPDEGGVSPLGEEAALLSLLLGSFVGARRLRVASGSPSALAAARSTARRAPGLAASVVLLGARTTGRSRRDLVADAVVDLSQPRPLVRLRDAGATAPSPRSGPRPAGAGSPDEAAVWARVASALVAVPLACPRPTPGARRSAPRDEAPDAARGEAADEAPRERRGRGRWIALP